MIELRWLIKRVHRPVGIDDGFYQPRLDPFIDVPTLQYREWPPGMRQTEPIPGDSSVVPNWIDVPSVHE